MIHCNLSSQSNQLPCGIICPSTFSPYSNERDLEAAANAIKIKAWVGTSYTDTRTCRSILSDGREGTKWLKSNKRTLKSRGCVESRIAEGFWFKLWLGKITGHLNLLGWVLVGCQLFLLLTRDKTVEEALANLWLVRLVASQLICLLKLIFLICIASYHLG